MYCRKCGEPMFYQETPEWKHILGSEINVEDVTLYFCPDCEWMYAYKETENGDLHEVDDFEV